MKKMTAFLLAMLLMFSAAAFADSTEMTTEDQMKNMVQNFLDENEYPYDYDDYTFSMQFAIDGALESAYVTVYVYDDMLAVSVDAPIAGGADVCEKMAVFTTLANDDVFYAQFRVSRDDDKIYISCRSCNLVEDVVPGENELYYLINEPLRYMELYGLGIKQVLDGGDPYQAYEACMAAVEAE